jgi:hypothetical protein
MTDLPEWEDLDDLQTAGLKRAFRMLYARSSSDNESTAQEVERVWRELVQEQDEAHDIEAIFWTVDGLMRIAYQSAHILAVRDGEPVSERLHRLEEVLLSDLPEEEDLPED